MELDYALLAERASRLDDGRLVIYGGDIDGFEAPKLPVFFQTTLVAKMLLEDGENPGGHFIEIACTGPNGERAVIMKDEGLDVAASNDEALRPAAGLLATLQMVFKVAGLYRLHLVVDGVDMKTIPLLVHSTQKDKTEEKHDENAVAHSH